MFIIDENLGVSYVYRDGMYVLSGDAAGYMKTWDVRTGMIEWRDVSLLSCRINAHSTIGTCVQAHLNEPTKKPISHVAVCYDDSGKDAKILEPLADDQMFNDMRNRGRTPVYGREQLR